MGYYIKSINIKKLLGYQNILIPISNSDEMRHLIITGANGSGKTTLLKYILSSLEAIKSDSLNIYADIEDTIAGARERLKSCIEKNDSAHMHQAENSLKFYEGKYNDAFGHVVIEGMDFYGAFAAMDKGEFVIASYGDFRKPEFEEVENPQKPNMVVKDITASKVSEFLRFMADLKIQQALAKNEGLQSDADDIQKWFDGFLDILRSIFEDPKLELLFNYKDYSFVIQNNGKVFKFTQLSAGYAAALDIVVDLMLKMQQKNRLVRAYDMPGIVLIDEIETHLHLKLQKQILPLLTNIFPKIQFIVTSHSPFVLNSLKNATAFDLEHQESIEDLTDYAYDALAEGYFGVGMEQGELVTRVDRLEMLLKKQDRSAKDNDELEYLIEDFKKIPDALAPNVKLRVQELLVENSQKG